MNHPERVNAAWHRVPGFHLNRMGWGTVFASAAILFGGLAIIIWRLN